MLNSTVVEFIAKAQAVLYGMSLPPGRMRLLDAGSGSRLELPGRLAEGSGALSTSIVIVQPRAPKRCVDLQFDRFWRMARFKFDPDQAAAACIRRNDAAAWFMH